MIVTPLHFTDRPSEHTNIFTKIQRQLRNRVTVRGPYKVMVLQSLYYAKQVLICNFLVVALGQTLIFQFLICMGEHKLNTTAIFINVLGVLLAIAYCILIELYYCKPSELIYEILKSRVENKKKYRVKSICLWKVYICSELT